MHEWGGVGSSGVFFRGAQLVARHSGRNYRGPKSEGSSRRCREYWCLPPRKIRTEIWAGMRARARWEGQRTTPTTTRWGCQRPEGGVAAGGISRKTGIDRRYMTAFTTSFFIASSSRCGSQWRWPWSGTSNRECECGTLNGLLKSFLTASRANFGENSTRAWQFKIWQHLSGPECAREWYREIDNNATAQTLCNGGDGCGSRKTELRRLESNE